MPVEGDPRMRRLAFGKWAAMVLVAFWLVGAGVARAGGDWNDDGIAWRSFDEGLALAKKEGKPVCLIVYTEWCPHCTNYSRVFHDEKVEKLSKNFVMIRLDQDQNKALTKGYAPDGAYIPRTIFLNSNGEIEPSIKARKDKYFYFYDERNAAPLLRAMGEMQAKASQPSDDS